MRKNRSVRTFTMILSCSIFLTGCGFVDIPDLTDEQTELISEYAVDLLLKDASGTDRRLLSSEEIQKAESEQAEEEKAHANERAGVNSENDTKKSTDKSENTSQGASDGETVTDTTISEFYKIEGMDIQFKDFNVCSSYPDDLSNAADTKTANESTSEGTQETSTDSTSDKKLKPSDNSSVVDSMYFSLDADPGKKLVVLNFTAVNTTDKDIDLNMASYSPSFAVVLNDGNTLSALTTLVPSDISSYSGKVPAGSSVIMTCMVQAKETDTASISSIVLKMKNKDETASIKLK